MAAAAAALAIAAARPARPAGVPEAASRPLLPPIEAIVLPAPSQGEAERIAGRLGFASLLLAGNAWTVTARLGNAALVWHDPATDRRFGLAAGAEVAPIVARRPPEPRPALPVGYWEEPGASAMPHANGAVTLVGITIVTDSLDRTCDRWWDDGTGDRRDFGPATEAPHLGARSRTGEARDPLGGRVRVRVIAPTRPDGPAARMMAGGAARWAGVTVGVRDLGLAARRLAQAGVRTHRVESAAAGGPLLWVDPREAGGVLFEFVPGPGPP
jgi:hypothetical protein